MCQKISPSIIFPDRKGETMKYLIAAILLFRCASAEAQWRSIGFPQEIYLFHEHQHRLFFSANVGGPMFYEYNDSGHFTEIYGGLDLSHGAVTSMASMDSCLFANNYRSTNDGVAWTTLKHGLIAISEHYVYGCSATSVYRSTDSGNTWVGIPAPTPDVFGVNGTCILAPGPNGVYRSNDTGMSWAKFGSLNYTINSIAFLGSLTFASSLPPNRPILKSTDSGATWTEIQLPDPTAVVVSSGPYVFAGTGKGVYVSTDSGNSWVQKNEGLGGYLDIGRGTIGVFDSLLFVNAQESANHLKTFSRPIREMVPPVSGVEQPIASLDALVIYPNPTLHSITIESSDELRSVELLDVLGVSKQIVAPRVQKTSLDLSLLPSGTYFLRIETAKGVVFRKVVRE
jgi:hypothetical protein